jgi:hypothetical protein
MNAISPMRPISPMLFLVNSFGTAARLGVSASRFSPLQFRL